MGYSVSWLATRGLGPDGACARLGLQFTGESEVVPESPLSGLALGDWFIVFANDFSFVGSLPLDALSRSADVLTCSIEEHVMVSVAEGWADGKCYWRVTHDSRQGLEHVNATGQLPSVFSSILADQRAEQTRAGGLTADVDHLFDVPVLLGYELTGFRHDRSGQTFKRLRTLKVAK